MKSTRMVQLQLHAMSIECNRSVIVMEDVMIRIPDRQEVLLFRALERELKKRATDILSDEQRYMIVADFVSKYDFSNSALAHKSASGWADMILSELEIEAKKEGVCGQKTD